MRRFKTRDVFACMRLIKHANIREEIKEIATNAEKANIKEIGVELMLGLVESLAERGAEKQLYEFLAGPFECDPEQIADLEPLQLIEKLKEFKSIEDEDGWKAFFQSVGAMMK